MLALKRGQTPGLLSNIAGNKKVSEVHINVTDLANKVNTCKEKCLGADRTVCLILEDLLEAKRHNSSVVLRSLSRYLTTNAVIPKADHEQILQTDRPALDFVLMPISSVETQAASPLFSVFNVPQIGYWASSPAFSNTNEYPLFYRINPSDEQQVKAIADLLDYLGVGYVILLAGDDDLYSKEAYDRLQREAVRRGTFCFALRRSILSNSKIGIRAIVQEVAAITTTRFIILFAPVSVARAFLDVYAASNLSGHVIIGSDDWVNRIDFSKLPPDSVLRQTPILGFGPDPSLFFPGRYSKLMGEFENRIRNHSYMFSLAQRGVPIGLYYEQERNCSFPNPAHCVVHTDPFRRFLRNCTAEDIAATPIRDLPLAKVLVFLIMTYSDLRLWNPALEPACDSQGRCRVLAWERTGDYQRDNVLHRRRYPCRPHRGKPRNCSLFNSDHSGYPGYELRTLARSKNGGLRLKGVAIWDGEEGHTFRTRLTWYNNSCVPLSMGQQAGSCLSSNSQVVRESTCSQPCPPGQYQLPVDRNPYHFCCWKCRECTSGHVSTGGDSHQCHPCPPGTVANQDKSKCTKPKELQPHWWPTHTYVVLTLSAVSTLLTVFCCQQLYVYRQKLVVRASQLPYMVVLGILCLVGQIFVICGFVATSDHLSPQLCEIHTEVSHAIAILVCVTVLAKTLPAMKLLDKLTRRVGITGSSNVPRLSFQLSICLTVSVAVYAIGFAVRRQHRLQITQEFLSPTTFVTVCDIDYNIAVSLAYTIPIQLLLLVTAVLAFRSRKTENVFINSDTYLIVLWAVVDFSAELIFASSQIFSTESNRDFIVGTYYYIHGCCLMLMLMVYAPRIWWARCGYKTRQERPAHWQRRSSSSPSTFSTSSNSSIRTSSTTTFCSSRTFLQGDSGYSCTCLVPGPTSYVTTSAIPQDIVSQQAANTGDQQQEMLGKDL